MYSNHTMTLQELNEDYNWDNAFGYAPFSREDVAEIIAYEEGQNDGDSWVGVFKLKDGRFGYVDAWCDYTGWDCQAGGDGEVSDTLEHLVRFELTSKNRRRLKMELADLDEVPNRPY